MSDDMQAWMEMNQKNEHHEHLAKAVGEWEVDGKFWMAPGQPPMETKGKSIHTSVLDGRFVQHQYSSTFAGAPFQGLGLDGYDNNKKKYVSLWTDSMSTGFCFLEGEREGAITTMLGCMPGPDGKDRTVKSVTEDKGDTLLFSMYDKTDDGWHQTMEMTYHRKS